MAPVHHAGNDYAIDVAENFRKRLGFFGCTLREFRPEGAGIIVRRNAQLFEVLAEIRNPVGEFM